MTWRWGLSPDRDAGPRQKNTTREVIAAAHGRRHSPGMPELNDTIDTYLAAWNETDATRRAALVERVWDPEGELCDPPMSARGHREIADIAAALHQQFPAHHFRRSSGVDAHHDRFRFSWSLVGPDGAVALVGLDTGELAPDGRLRRITGFFGPLPERA